MAELQKSLQYGLKRWQLLLLCAALLSAQLVEAGHVEEADCEDELCLICHASMDEEQLCLHSSVVIPPRPNSAAAIGEESAVAKACSVALHIRAPPQFFL